MQAPYSSVSDLAGWNKYDRRKCLSIVTKLQGIGYVGYQKMGNTKPAVDRYWVAELGNRYWKQHFDDEETLLGNTARELKLLRDRFPMVEQIYHRLSAFTGDGGANEVSAFRWLRSSSIHAVAEFDGGHWVMFIVAGLWADRATMKQKWALRFRNLIHTNHAAMRDQLSGVSDVDHTARPSAIAVIAVDEWAAQVAVDELAPYVDNLTLRVFTPDADLSGDFAFRPSRDTLTEPPRRRGRRSQKPPTASPSAIDIADVPTYRTFSTTVEWLGIRNSQIADMLGYRTNAMNSLVETLSGKKSSKRSVDEPNGQGTGLQRSHPVPGPPPELLTSFAGRNCPSINGLDLSADWSRISV